ncbi:unnamed protein product [Nyctereutes procyonoides]|uniref:(raccoon dog) hypothetical protein n=1 Tax=Nyctereutes procyonoides TaxID=34880 RepID=A0A811ZA58_NYCPR|nr:unnamed protein product [Nyctereutes procyonoides]
MCATLALRPPQQTGLQMRPRTEGTEAASPHNGISNEARMRKDWLRAPEEPSGMGWFHPHSHLCPAPLCQLYTEASRPFGAVLMVRRINERKVPGTAPAWAWGLGIRGESEPGIPLSVSPHPGRQGHHPTPGNPTSGYTEGSEWSQVLWRAPKGHTAGLETAASLCLPLQLKEECGQFSGMSLSVLQRPPNL